MGPFSQPEVTLGPLTGCVSVDQAGPDGHCWPHSLRLEVGCLELR